MAQVLVVVVCFTHAVQPSADVAMVGPTTPLVVANAVPRLVVYFTESAKYASSAVTRFRRSDFIEARYAFSFVLRSEEHTSELQSLTNIVCSLLLVRKKPLRFIRQPPRRGKSRTLSNEYSAAHISKPHAAPSLISISADCARR